MKKLSSYILIALLIINIFAPFGIALNSNNIVKVEKNTAYAADCEVIQANWNPEGEQKKDGSDKFFKEGVTAKIIVKTKNCVNQPSITLTVFEADTCVVANCDDALSDSGLLRRPINIPTDNFTMNIKLGEEECEAGATGAIGYDCDLFFYIRQGDTTLYNSYAESKDLYYECDGACDTNAAFLGITPQGTDANPIKDEVTNINAQKAIENTNTYTLLAPIGNLTEINTSGGTCPGNPEIQNGIGCYLNIIFKIAIGLCGALAVIMIIVAGVQYMGDESVFGKTEAKSKITSAILGLLIALAAYALLNTLDPALTGKNGVTVDQVGIEIVDAPEAGDDTVDPGFAKQDYRYSSDATVSTGVTNVVAKLKQGWEINAFRVYSNERMTISLRKGAEVDNTNTIDIRSGANGFSEIGQARSKDKKTPKGTWKILQIRTSKDGKPVYNRTGSNMGATFWLLSPTTNGDRGIGMHGNKNGTLSRTAGCVRLKNSDLLALLPYVKVGIPVIIN